MDQAMAIHHHFGHGVADFQIKKGKLEWVGPGPKPPREQIEQWDKERLIVLSLRAQKRTCKNELERVEYRISNYPPHPENNEEHKTYIDELRVCMASKVLMNIPVDPGPRLDAEKVASQS